MSHTNTASGSSKESAIVIADSDGFMFSVPTGAYSEVANGTVIPAPKRPCVEVAGGSTQVVKKRELVYLKGGKAKRIYYTPQSERLEKNKPLVKSKNQWKYAVSGLVPGRDRIHNVWTDEIKRCLGISPLASFDSESYLKAMLAELGNITQANYIMFCHLAQANVECVQNTGRFSSAYMYRFLKANWGVDMHPSGIMYTHSWVPILPPIPLFSGDHGKECLATLEADLKDLGLRQVPIFEPGCECVDNFAWRMALRGYWVPYLYYPRMCLPNYVLFVFTMNKNFDMARRINWSEPVGDDGKHAMFEPKRCKVAYLTEPARTLHEDAAHVHPDNVICFVNMVYNQPEEAAKVNWSIPKDATGRFTDKSV